MEEKRRLKREKKQAEREAARTGQPAPEPEASEWEGG